MKKILDKEKSNLLVEFLLNSKEDFVIEKSADKSIDFIVKSSEQVYAVFTRYRNFPDTETKSRTLTNEEEKRIENVCKAKYIPVIAYAFFIKETDKIYVFLMTLDKMRKLTTKDDNAFLNPVLHGMDIKLGVGNSFERELYNSLNMHVDILEVSISQQSIDKSF